MYLKSRRLIRHAAHAENGPGGHDLEEWIVAFPELPALRAVAELGVPADATWSHGYLDGSEQCWVWTAKRPMSPGVCAFPGCTTVRIGTSQRGLALVALCLKLISD